MINVTKIEKMETKGAYNVITTKTSTKLNENHNS